MKNTGFSSYVDDNTPYTTSEKIDDVVSTLEETVKVMFRWFTENQMKLNADKCQIWRAYVQELVKECRSSRTEGFLRKGVLKICSNFTEEHLRISIKLQSNFIEIMLRYGCSPVNLKHKNTTGGLLLRMFASC